MKADERLTANANDRKTEIRHLCADCTDWEYIALSEYLRSEEDMPGITGDYFRLIEEGEES